MIVGIAGSGRANGNSARLLACALTAASQAVRGPVTTYELGGLGFRGCIGCRACRLTHPSCVLEDDLSPVLQATAAADALVLAAPIYYGYVSGIFKAYLDRWYSFRAGDGSLRVREGRPALLILTQGNRDPDAYDWTIRSLRKVLTAYGLRPSVLVGPGLEGAQDASGDAALLAEAARLGASLVG